MRGAPVLLALFAAAGCAPELAATPSGAGDSAAAGSHLAADPGVDGSQEERSAAQTSPESYDGPPKRVLVELFSSQGCNSCPAADAVVGAFPEHGWGRDKVIALTYHVTYWDDLGWQDPYAQPLFDVRQIGYAQQVAAARDDDETTIRGPYTPQMVVDGRVHFSGALADVAQRQLTAARNAPTLVHIEAHAEAQGEPGVVSVAVQSRRDAAADFDTDQAKVGLFAALSQRSLITKVPRGENAGKELTEHWVVRAFAGPKLFRSARELNETKFELAVPDDGVALGDLEVVVFAQDLATLRVVGVTSAAVAD
ncbi:MAG: DUF1223 domain-containing protein [Myxococcota bacterium]